MFARDGFPKLCEKRKKERKKFQIERAFSSGREIGSLGMVNCEIVCGYLVIGTLSRSRLLWMK